MRHCPLSPLRSYSTASNGQQRISQGRHHSLKDMRMDAVMEDAAASLQHTVDAGDGSAAAATISDVPAFTLGGLATSAIGREQCKYSPSNMHTARKLALSPGRALSSPVRGHVDCHTRTFAGKGELLVPLQGPAQFVCLCEKPQCWCGKAPCVAFKSAVWLLAEQSAVELSTNESFIRSERLSCELRTRALQSLLAHSLLKAGCRSSICA